MSLLFVGVVATQLLAAAPPSSAPPEAVSVSLANGAANPMQGLRAASVERERLGRLGWAGVSLIAPVSVGAATSIGLELLAARRDLIGAVFAGSLAAVPVLGPALLCVLRPLHEVVPGLTQAPGTAEVTFWAAAGAIQAVGLGLIIADALAPSRPRTASTPRISVAPLVGGGLTVSLSASL